MTDWLDIVEAAYDVQEASHQHWLKRLMDVVGSKMGNTHGVVGAIFHFPRDGALQILPHRLAPDGFFEGAQQFASNDQHLMRTLFTGAPFATMSMHIGRAALRESDALRTNFRATGIGDMLGLVARDPGPWGVNIGTPLAKPERISAARAAPWARVAAHVHSGLRLRFGIHGEPPLSSTGALVELHDDIAAFLNDDGKVIHAAGAAVADRTRLRDAARSITRARTKTRKRDVNHALLEWQSLVEGKWTLIDHFDSDGRRFLVARRNPPGGPDHAALSLDEARAASFRAMGHPLKLIAYELGFSLGTVSRLLRSAARKLGLESSHEFSHFAGEKTEVPGTPPSA